MVAELRDSDEGEGQMIWVFIISFIAIVFNVLCTNVNEEKLFEDMKALDLSVKIGLEKIRKELKENEDGRTD